MKIFRCIDKNMILFLSFNLLNETVIKKLDKKRNKN